MKTSNSQPFEVSEALRLAYVYAQDTLHGHSVNADLSWEALRKYLQEAIKECRNAKNTLLNLRNASLDVTKRIKDWEAAVEKVIGRQPSTGMNLSTLQSAIDEANKFIQPS